MLERSIELEAVTGEHVDVLGSRHDEHRGIVDRIAHAMVRGLGEERPKLGFAGGRRSKLRWVHSTNESVASNHVVQAAIRDDSAN